MDVVEAVKKNKHYLKCKLIVKNWETSFKEKHSRLPSKYDIKEAPTKIKYAYKKYYQMKSDALQTSLSFCDIDDDIAESPEPEPQLEKSLSPIELLPLPSGQQLTELLFETKKKENSKISSHKIIPFTENLSKKLFQNSKFSLRNPRKSFNLSKTQPNQTNLKEDELNELTVVDRNVFDSGKENLLVTKSPIDCPTNFLKTDTQSIIQSIPTRQLDFEWLNRSSKLVNIEAKTEQPANKCSYSFGVSNMKVTEIMDKQNDIVENSESEDDLKVQELKPALKKRKLSSTMTSLSMHSDSEKKHITPEKIPTHKKQSSSKPSLKDSHNNIKSIRKANHIMNIIENSEPPDLSEYIPFGIEQHYIPRHSQVTDLVNNKNSAVKPSSSNNPIDKIEQKILNGTINDNFVKINIEKKVFVRGKKSVSYSKYKKNLWKSLKSNQKDGESNETNIICFKCNMSGHFARYCKAHKGDSLLPLESYNDNTLPTLEDMQDVVNSEYNKDSTIDILNKCAYQPSVIPEDVMKLLSDTQEDLKPLYSEHNINETTQEIVETLSLFGHDSFRSGQKEAVMRILCGKSTLLVLPTGCGKSLCYQLPAFMYSKYYKCVTLVISPLVSLMEDQVLNMPSFLKAGCLHTNQPPTQRRKIIECLKNGMINILLISPEALVSVESSNGFFGLFKSLPQIAFACIDEAHCVSQWSHNFRPSYLMICKVLKEKLNVKCILGLTATATQSTIRSIINHIGIGDGIDGVITNPVLPDNLKLSVSYEEDKDKALVSFLTSERVNEFCSIIVYCIRRDECERVASLLRSCLQAPGKINMERNNKRKRMSYVAEAYHAGMSAAQRKKIQKHFMDGTLRIIVATVAFGMGINKPDIRCIIHYNMPSSFESYVQEVGRAGRDGQIAFCHTFMLKNNNSDKHELLKHIYSNTIDRPTIRKLLEKIFIPCNCRKLQENSVEIDVCKGHEVGIPIDSTVEELDIASENISTLLCYIELHSKRYVKVLNNGYINCKISSYGGPQKILEAATSCPPLAMAYILESKKNPEIINRSIIEFQVIEVAAAIGWDSGVAKYKLKNLEWVTENGTFKKSQLKVEFNTLGFRIKAPGDLTPNELDSTLDDMHNIVVKQENKLLFQLEEITSAFKQLGNWSYGDHLSENALLEKSNHLKQLIEAYFLRVEAPDDVVLEQRQLDVDRVISDVNALISSYKDCNFTGRSIARIFQGISSPNYPAVIWGRTRFWRSHMQEDFYGLLKLATQQIIEMK